MLKWNTIRLKGRFACAIVISLGVHWVCLWRVANDRPSKSSQPVSVRITIKESKDQIPVNKTSQALPGGKSKNPGKAATYRQSAARTAYKNLLPSSTERANAAFSMDADRASDEYANTVGGADLAASGPMQQVADGIDLALTIPEQLRLLYRSGHAEVLMVKQQEGRWQIRIARGDRFYRALLYERLMAILADPDQSRILSRLHSDRVWIEISFVAQTSYQRRPIERRWTTRKNRMILTVHEFRVPEELGVVQYVPGDEEDEGGPAMMLDVLAPFKMAADYVWGDDEELSPVMKQLTRSAAYPHPIPKG